VQHVDHNPPKKNVIATKPDVFVLAIGEQKRSWRTQEFIIALVRWLRQNSQLRWCDESQEFIIALVRWLRQNSQLRWCDESFGLRGSITKLRSSFSHPSYIGLNEQLAVVNLL
jgi:hypothetical protein